MYTLNMCKEKVVGNLVGLYSRKLNNCDQLNDVNETNMTHGKSWL